MTLEKDQIETFTTVRGYNCNLSFKNNFSLAKFINKRLALIFLGIQTREVSNSMV